MDGKKKKNGWRHARNKRKGKSNVFGTQTDDTNATDYYYLIKTGASHYLLKLGRWTEVVFQLCIYTGKKYIGEFS